jgi:PAS domain S-box-containing protein
LDTYQTYKAVFEDSPDAIVIVDDNGLIMLANKQAEILFGYQREEMIEKEIELLIPDRFRQKHKVERNAYNLRPVPRTMGRGLEISARRKDGSEFPVEISLSPIKHDTKTLVAAAVRDITERKEIEAKLLEKEKKYRDTLDNMLEGVFILDYNFRFVYFNEAYVKQSKFKKEELLGHSIMERFPGIEETEIFKTYRQCMSERISKHLEIKFIFPDNSRGWFEVSVQPVPEGIFGLVIEITERKQAEEQIANQRKFIQAILNNLPADIAVFDGNHNYRFINPHAISTPEFREWLIGKTDFDYCHYKGIDDSLAHKRRRLFNEAVQTKTDVEWVDEHKTKQNDTIYVLRKFHPVFENNEVAYVIGYGIDMTSHVETEMKLKEAIVTAQNANKELEQFAYMVSHDLQEPLRMVSSFLGLLKLETEDHLDESAKEYIHFAVDGAQRMKILIEDLLQYSRVGTNKENFTATDMNEVMQYVTQVLEDVIEKNEAKIVIKPLPVITANKVLIAQLFVNLLSNALKYRSDKTPEIEIGTIERDEQWMFYVKDNGIGINQKFYEKIFIIFNRLHGKGKYSGTGIGLAVCKKIAQVHRGSIWVESEEGAGSTFYFAIPKNIQ